MDDAISSQECYYSPLEESWNTILNVSRPKLDDPGSLLAGERNSRGRNDFQCRFHDGISGRCWKDVCYRAHDYLTGEKISSLNVKFTSRTDKISALHNPELFQSIKFGVDIVVNGFVSHVLSPWDFFVTSATGRCICRDHTKNKERAIAPTFKELTARLNEALNYGQKHLLSKTLHYSEFDWVASKLLLTGETEELWMRAIVLEVYEEPDVTMMTMDSLLIHFIDIGLNSVVSIDKVVPLPSAFAAVAPMAYHCRLTGVSPKDSEWSKEATKLFRDTFPRCAPIFIRIIDSKPEDYYVLKRDLYSVELLQASGDKVNAAHKLADEDHGILWNYFPFRPSINRLIPRSARSWFARLDPKPVPQSVIDRSRKATPQAFVTSLEEVIKEITTNPRGAQTSLPKPDISMLRENFILDVFMRKLVVPKFNREMSNVNTTFPKKWGDSEKKSAHDNSNPALAIAGIDEPEKSCAENEKPVLREWNWDDSSASSSTSHDQLFAVDDNRKCENVSADTESFEFSSSISSTSSDLSSWVFKDVDSKTKLDRLSSLDYDSCRWSFSSVSICNDGGKASTQTSAGSGGDKYRDTRSAFSDSPCDVAVAVGEEKVQENVVITPAIPKNYQGQRNTGSKRRRARRRRKAKKSGQNKCIVVPLEPLGK